MMSVLPVAVEPSMANLCDNKPPSEEAGRVSDATNDNKIPETNSIEELKKLTELISIRLVENGQRASKMKSIFSFKRTVPPIRHRIFQQRLNGRQQNAHQPHFPTTCWQKFIRIWSTRDWVRRIRRRIRRRRRRILLQILQNAQNPPPPRRQRNAVPLLARVRRGLLNMFRLGRPLRVAPVNNGPEIRNQVVVGPRQQNVFLPRINRLTMNRNDSIIHNNSLRRRTHLLELLDVEIVVKTDSELIIYNFIVPISIPRFSIVKGSFTK